MWCVQLLFCLFLVHTSLWKIQDGLVRIKKIIVDTVEQWNSRLSDVVRKSDKKKDKSQVESDGPRTPEILESDHSMIQSNEGANSGSPAITKKIRSLDQSDGDGDASFISHVCNFVNFLQMKQHHQSVIKDLSPMVL